MLTYCLECGKEYELESGDKLSDFQCECGGKLASKAPPEKQKGLTNDPVIRIIVIFIGGFLFLNYVAVYLFMFLLYGLQQVGSSGGAYIFAIFFGICIALITGLLGFAFKKR